MPAAMDQNDRNQALAVWAGLFCGGPIIPVVVLAVNWGKPRSLARSQAVVASIMWAVVLVIYVPVAGRMVLVGGPDVGFWAVWAVVVLATLVTTIVNVIRVIRAPLVEAAEPRDATR